MQTTVDMGFFASAQNDKHVAMAPLFIQTSVIFKKTMCCAVHDYFGMTEAEYVKIAGEFLKESAKVAGK